MADKNQQHSSSGDNVGGDKLTADKMYNIHQVDGNVIFQIQNNPLPAPKIPDFYPPSEIRNATHFYIPTQWQNIPPSINTELNDSFTDIARKPTLPHFMNRVFSSDLSKQVDTKFFLVLADSGMGKTTLMINLFLEWNKKKRHKEMRLFHIANYKTWHYIEKIKKIDKAEETILLLDAFDEDQLAVENYKKRLENIIEFTQDFYKVIITSRTQFFPSEKEIMIRTKIPTSKGPQKLSRMYISPFDDKDVEKYLKKRFRKIFKFWNNKKFTQAKNLIHKAPNLIVRPMLLAYIHDFIRDIKKNENENKYQYSFQIYEAMVYKWIKREAKRLVEPKKQRDFAINLYKFSVKMAGYLYHNPYKGEYKIHRDSLNPFAKEHGITLSKIEMTSKSLLNRNADGYYKFSHKSVLEYFLIIKYIQDFKFTQSFNFQRMSQSKVFHREMIKQAIEVKNFKKNFLFVKADLIGINLSSTNLSKADLIGTNLSKANLSKADLIGANLAEANLIEADFRGADLRSVNLMKATLGYANFAKANLIGAYLIGSNLAKTNLEGSNLYKSTLTKVTLTQSQYDYAKKQGAILKDVNVVAD